MKYILGLGSNLGEKELLILQAVSMIKERIGSVQEISAMYKSAPIGFESENEFLNCCISIETVLSPLILLREIKKIEGELGRGYTTTGYEDRLIDIDIILGEKKISQGKLKIPHPRYASREFVLLPLNDLSEFIDPLTFLKSYQLNA
ncbi:MAG: hypothetical protein RL037_221 [Bacteroidota bacterium]|jgi:2-amino-4-hydroxy-6-hydroxymethyldihydropteridine diphosphokinase